MKILLSPLLFGSILLCSLAGCKKETAVSQPALVTVPNPVTALSVSRTKLMIGTWRTLALGPDLNKNQKLDSSESNPQLDTYLEFGDYNSDGSGTYRVMKEGSRDSVLTTFAFRWYVSNNGENIIAVSDTDTTVLTILSLNENTFNWSRKTVSTQWFGFCSR